MRGVFATYDTRLRVLRNEVRSALARLNDYKLLHIDRRLNEQVERLANLAFDRKRTIDVCGIYMR